MNIQSETMKSKYLRSVIRLVRCVCSIVGILMDLLEVWIQLYSFCEIIDFTPSANIRHCIEKGKYSQTL